MPIPTPERRIARLVLARHCRKHPPGATMPLVREQHQTLRDLIARHNARATARVQIKRLPGMEASSTNYSLAMVADHLARVNQGLARGVADLAAERPCELVADPALFKPSPDAEPTKALDDLDASERALDAALADLGAIDASTRTHEHPWFGPLPARMWACFPTFHNAVHLKQADLIALGLHPA